MGSSLPQNGQRVFEAKGKPAPKNFLRILSMFLDYQQRGTVDFGAKTIKFEDAMLPNKFLTLWTEPEMTIRFGDIVKLSENSLDGTQVFNVVAKQGKAPLLAKRFDEFEELRETIGAIFQSQS